MRNNTFPGEVLMELAVDTLDTAGVEWPSRVAYPDPLSTHLPEIEFRPKSTG